MQLAWRNHDDGVNARIMISPGSFTFTTPARQYKEVQVYFLSTEGSSPVTVTLNYQGGSIVPKSVAVPDWSKKFGALGAGQFTLIDSIDRYDNNSKQPWKVTELCIVGQHIVADPQKTLASVTVAKTGADACTTFFIFFEAVAITP